MPRAHIVYCHLEPHSFVAAMAEEAVRSLVQQGWDVTRSNLYEKGFDPVARDTDFAERSNSEHLVYALEQRHARATGTLATDIEQELKPVLEANLLVLAFPIFWFSMPAMLKGWIDRVFISGTFYGGRTTYDRGGMVGRNALVLTSLGGRPHMFGVGSIHGELQDSMLSHLLRGTLGYVGYRVYEPFIAYHVPYVSYSERQQILQTLSEQLAQLDQRAILPMPSLDGFDAQFRPLIECPKEPTHDS